MTVALLLLAVGLVAYSNGANDNFKGVASLFGSRTTSYRSAIGWATVTTFAGSLAAIALAQSLLNAFSGKDLVPDAALASEIFLAAVAFGAGATLILATLTGFPISTTHALTGALVGSGWLAAGSSVDLSALGRVFVLPLLLSPVLAVAVGAAVYLLFRWLRIRIGVEKEWCICVGSEQRVVSIAQPASLLAAAAAPPAIAVSVGEVSQCAQRYAGTF
jgi:PiT family inorganic phosphate transporter